MDHLIIIKGVAYDERLLNLNRFWKWCSQINSIILRWDNSKVGPSFTKKDVFSATQYLNSQKEKYKKYHKISSR